MKKTILVLTTLALSAFTSAALAEDVSLHLTGGAAESLRAPSDNILTSNRFNMGMSGDAKLLFKLMPNLAVGPSATVVYLPESAPVATSNSAVLWTFGGTARLQGNREAASWSPYVDVTGGAAKQGTIWNPGLLASAGVEFAVESTHTVWAGPYVAYNHTFDVSSNQTNLLNHHDPNILTAGLSVSFDAPVKPKTVVQTQTEIQQQVVYQTVEAPATPVVSAVAPEKFELDQVVMFDKGSASLDQNDDTVLLAIAKEINNHPGYSVRVIGSASSEGDSTVNLKLAHERALNVVKSLITNGVDGSRLSAASVGEVGSPNDASNRKVDFVTFSLVRNK